MNPYIDAFFHLTHGRLPLYWGRDKVFVSPEAIGPLKRELEATWSYVWPFHVDERLVGVEMRLEWKVTV